MSELSSRLANIHRQIHEAMDEIDKESAAPDDTKEIIHRLVETSDQLHQRWRVDITDPAHMATEVQNLEKLAGQAKAKIIRDRDHQAIGSKSFQLFTFAHNTISHLRADLHEQTGSPELSPTM